MIFEVRPGDAASPVILHVPHASRELTAFARSSLVIDDAELADELDHLTDAHTDVVAASVAASTGAWVFQNRWSRLVVDPERFPDEREEMLAAGMGAVYTHGYAGRRLRSSDPERDARLIREHFEPYAAGMTRLVGERLAAIGRVVIVDVHSYPVHALPYELHGDGPRPPICLGTDTFHTPAALIDRAKAAFPDMSLDSPFAGCYVPLKYYGVDPAVEAVMIEIRRDCDPAATAARIIEFLR
ncbi:N-formylglutamate amidohydrolase [Actinoplanes sp. NPDC049596]|uniref:N-formylglutamate amidohydrolase n=1 Tax=unclassified Actinoplanes TaxID=2626549 RepID=UPI00342A0968